MVPFIPPNKMHIFVTGLQLHFTTLLISIYVCGVNINIAIRSHSFLFSLITYRRSCWKNCSLCFDQTKSRTETEKGVFQRPLQLPSMLTFSSFNCIVTSGGWFLLLLWPLSSCQLTYVRGSCCIFMSTLVQCGNNVSLTTIKSDLVDQISLPPQFH